MFSPTIQRILGCSGDVATVVRSDVGDVELGCSEQADAATSSNMTPEILRLAIIMWDLVIFEFIAHNQLVIQAGHSSLFA